MNAKELSRAAHLIASVDCERLILREPPKVLVIRCTMPNGEVRVLRTMEHVKQFLKDQRL